MKLLQRALVALILIATISSCSSTTSPTNNNNNNNNNTAVDNQGPVATASWDSTYKAGGTNPVKANIIRFVWMGGKLYGFGSLNGDATQAAGGVWNVTSFTPIPTLPSFTDPFNGVKDASFDGSKVHVVCYVSSFDKQMATFDGTSWSVPRTNSFFSGDGFASTASNDYIWTQPAFDSGEVDRLTSTGYEYVKGWKRYQVDAMIGRGNDLYVARELGQIIGTPSSIIEKFDGTTWTTLPVVDGSVERLRFIGNDLYALGWLGLSSAEAPAAKWNGTSWTSVPAGDLAYQTKMSDMDIDKDGNYYFASTYKVYKYDGTTTKLLATANGPITAIAIYKGALLVSGGFTSLKDANQKNIASSGLAVFH